MSASRQERIQQVLSEEFQPSSLEIIDESWKHAGHAGAREQGGGHFAIRIVSQRFSGLSRLQRHRLVMQALSQYFGPDIHALSIQAQPPEEA